MGGSWEVGHVMLGGLAVGRGKGSQGVGLEGGAPYIRTFGNLALGAAVGAVGAAVGEWEDVRKGVLVRGRRTAAAELGSPLVVRGT